MIAAISTSTRCLKDGGMISNRLGAGSVVYFGAVHLRPRVFLDRIVRKVTQALILIEGRFRRHLVGVQVIFIV